MIDHGIDNRLTDDVEMELVAAADAIGENLFASVIAGHVGSDVLYDHLRTADFYFGRVLQNSALRIHHFVRLSNTIDN